jgi:hypothetical protein
LNTATDVANSPAVSGGTLKDEDIDATIQAQPAGSAYQRWYNNGTAWLRSIGSVPFYYGTYIQYSNAGTLTDLTNNETTIIWHACAPAQDTTYQHYFITHTAKYSSVAAAEAANFAYSDFGWLVDQEGVVLWKLIYQANAGDANTGKCRLMAVQQMSRSRNSTVSGASTSLAYTAISGVPENTVLGRSSTGTGYAESIACLAGGRALLGTVTALTSGYVPVAGASGILADSVLRQNSSKIGIGMEPTGTEALQVSGRAAVYGGASPTVPTLSVVPSSGDPGDYAFVVWGDAPIGTNRRFSVARGGAAYFDGKVGIVMDPTGTEALQVGGAISVYPTNTFGIGLYLRKYDSAEGGELVLVDNTTTWHLDVFNGTLRFMRHGANDGSYVATDLTFAAGKVGIGRTPTTYALEVAGAFDNYVTSNDGLTTTSVVSNMDCTGLAVRTQNVQNSVNAILSGIRFAAFNGTGAIACSYNASQSADMIFGVSNGSASITERMRITAAGKVGIGRIPTTRELEVNGSAYASTSVLIGTTTPHNDEALLVRTNGAVIDTAASGTLPTGRTVSVANINLELFCTDNTAPVINGTSFGTGGGLAIRGYRSAGTRSSPTAVDDNAGLVQIVGGGYDGSTWYDTKAQYLIRAGSAWTTTNHETEHLWTGVPNGSTTVETWMTLTEGKLVVAGNLELGAGGSANIYQSDDTQSLKLYGGALAGGANIELYGSTHATLADRAYYDADLHSFRKQDASTTLLYLDTANGRAGFSRSPTTHKLEVAGTIYATGGSTPGTPSTGEVLIGNGYVRADAAIRSNSFLSADGGYVYAYSYLFTDGYLKIKDAMTAPATSSGYALIYVDSADGDLKVKFGDGTVKTIVTDT